MASLELDRLIFPARRTQTPRVVVLCNFFHPLVDKTPPAMAVCNFCFESKLLNSYCLPDCLPKSEGISELSREEAQHPTRQTEKGDGGV